MMMAGCEKQADNETSVTKMNSFDLEIQGFNGSSDAKTHWYNDVFWWDNEDKVVINGAVFSVVKEDTVWKAKTNIQGVEAIGGYYYLAYPYDENERARFNNLKYGPITLDGTIIPLAAKTDSNKMTLTPCCAVIKGASSVGFYSDREGNEPGCSGKVYTSDNVYINTSNATLEDGTPMDMENGENELWENGDGYIIIYLAGESVTAYLKVTDNVNYEERMTKEPVTLQKGRIYVIGN